MPKSFILHKNKHADDVGLLSDPWRRLWMLSCSHHEENVVGSPGHDLTSFPRSVSFSKIIADVFTPRVSKHLNKMASSWRLLERRWNVFMNQKRKSCWLDASLPASDWSDASILGCSGSPGWSAVPPDDLRFPQIHLPSAADHLSSRSAFDCEYLEGEQHWWTRGAGITRKASSIISSPRYGSSWFPVSLVHIKPTHGRGSSRGAAAAADMRCQFNTEA